jgi:broad specificity phosphatase PhoE
VKKIKLLLVLFLFVVEWVPAEPISTGGADSPAAPQVQTQAAPKRWRRLFIIRHGQRPNEMDPRLSVLGRKQAALVADRLKADGFDGEIYASPYKRTVETAVPVAKLLGKKIRLCPDFQEATYKEGSPNTPGLTQAELQAMFPDLVADIPMLPFPWVLSDHCGPGLRKNIEEGLERILEETSGDVAVFTHGGPVRTAVELLTENTNTQLDFKVWNCMLCTFLVRTDGTIAFIGVTADFMPPDEITSNEGRGILGVNVPSVMPEKE